MQAKQAFDESVQSRKSRGKQSSKKYKTSPKVQALKRYPAGDPLPSDPLGQKLSELFVNGWDWIYSPAPADGAAVTWKTIKNYPLSPIQMWDHHQDPDSLIGIRPKAQTRWIIIDIDRNSPHHPSQTPDGLTKIRDALEDIGICRILINQSSHSGGIHIYCPLPEAVSSFWLSVCVKFALEAIAIRLKSGECELFPNPKRYLPKGRGFSNYAAIRLPMQPDSGFVPLDEDLNPLPWTLEHWFGHFESLSEQQDFPRLEKAIADGKANFKIRKNRDPQSISNWEASIAHEKREGWTGPGQTNEKLKCFGCEARVFLGLDNIEDIAEHIHTSAINSPGFTEHSRHTRDIRKRSYEIANWAMGYYWPYGSDPNRSINYHGQSETKLIDFTYHQKLKQEGQERIKAALKHLKESDRLSSSISERANQLILEAKVSKKSLYKSHNLELWHPKFCLEAPELELKSQSSEPAIKSSEKHTGKGCLPFANKRSKKDNLETLKPLSNKESLPAPYNEGFVENVTPDRATDALPPQGQRAAKGASYPITSSNSNEGEKTLEQVSQDSQDSIEPISPSAFSTQKDWDDLKASLPPSLQKKIKQQQRQKELEQNPSKKVYYDVPLHLEQQHSLKEARQGTTIESIHREPTETELSEFNAWYELALAFKLVTDSEWRDSEYWVQSSEQWQPYNELSAMFTQRRLRRLLSERHKSE